MHSKNMPVASYTYINLCVCPGGSWICFEGSLLEVRFNLYPLQSSYLFCMPRAGQRWPCLEVGEPRSWPSAALLPAAHPAASPWWLQRGERMFVTFSPRAFVSVHICMCVSKTWPGYRKGWITPSGLSVRWTGLGLGRRGSFMPQHTFTRVCTLSSILLTNGGVMKEDMPIHPRFETTAGGKVREEAESMKVKNVW